MEKDEKANGKRKQNRLSHIGAINGKRLQILVRSEVGIDIYNGN